MNSFLDNLKAARENQRSECDESSTNGENKVGNDEVDYELSDGEIVEDSTMLEEGEICETYTRPAKQNKLSRKIKVEGSGAVVDEVSEGEIVSDSEMGDESDISSYASKFSCSKYQPLEQDKLSTSMKNKVDLPEMPDMKLFDAEVVKDLNSDKSSPINSIIQPLRQDVSCIPGKHDTKFSAPVEAMVSDQEKTEETGILVEEGSGSDNESRGGSKAVKNDVNEVDQTNRIPEGLIGYKTRRFLLNQPPASSTGPLPEGWIKTTHSSGFPIYFHRQTRVVTWSRPYTLISGHVSIHDIPLESIPCLYLKKNSRLPETTVNSIKQEKEETTVNVCSNFSTNSATSTLSQFDKKDQSQANEPQCLQVTEIKDGAQKDEANGPSSLPKVTIQDSKPLYISGEDLQAYLEKRFEFETRKIPHFEKWAQRREFHRNLKRKRAEEANDAVDEEKNKADAKGSAANLITITVEDGEELVLNTTSKPMICILHEYAQRILKTQPQYTFVTKDDAAEPFEAIIKLHDKVYGRAFAINKKTAKNKAALATLEMLIPGFKGQMESKHGHPDMKCFNDVLVSDPRVHELCTHTGQLQPYQLLTECLKRHQGVADTNISYDVQPGKKRTLTYTMMCGKYMITGSAKNKKIGKQLAAQKILQQIHPEVETWLELIEKYGTPMAQERAKRKREEQEIFDLKQRKNYADDDDENNSSSTASERLAMEPNPELLAKLREMMFKLRRQQEEKEASAAEDARLGRKRLTPMAAAIAADRGLITSKDDRKPTASMAP